MTYVLNLSFLVCTKVELWDLTVCIVVNGEKFRSGTVTLTLVRQCPISNLSEIFLYTTCSDFIFLDQFFFKLSCKNTLTQTRTHSNTNAHTHRDSDKYSIVVFSKKATIKMS